jgi:hypothetical protein
MIRLIIIFLLISAPVFAEEGFKEFRTNNKSKYQGLDLSLSYPDQFIMEHDGDYTIFHKELNKEALMALSLQISTITSGAFREYKRLNNTQIGKKLLNDYLQSDKDKLTIFASKPIVRSSCPGFEVTSSLKFEDEGKSYMLFFSTIMGLLVKDKLVTLSCGIMSKNMDDNYVSKLFEENTSLCSYYFQSLKIYP